MSNRFEPTTSFESQRGPTSAGKEIRRTTRLTFLLLVAVGVCSAGSDNPKRKTPDASLSQMAEYLIGSDDVLAVNVWKEPEISRSVPVRPDGKISLPLIGDVRASGRTPVQLQGDIKKELLTYLADPQVTVIVQEAKSQKFNILGQVEHPGSYPLSRSMTVLDAIAVAGGFRDFAKTGKIYVLRIRQDGSNIRMGFNYKKVVKGSDLSQNVVLEPHDTVVVP